MEEQATVSLFERCTPGVVFITNEALGIESTTYEMKEVPQGTGSGWIYDADGHIITNYHVIKGAQALKVRFIDGTEVPAGLVGADPGSDVAVLSVRIPPGRSKLLRPLSRKESGQLFVGQDVYAIGNPFGLEHTLTKGIVSGVGRTITSIGGSPIQGAIQTDASINPGNSGGPLLDSQGRVIGMNTAIYSPSGASAGVGFAIPCDTVTARANLILNMASQRGAGQQRQPGTILRRPSLGLFLGQDGIARRLIGQDGAFVAGLSRGGGAGRAGIQRGDILIQIDGRRVRQVNDVYAVLDGHEPGDTVDIRLLRPADIDEAGVPGSYRELALRVELLESSK